MLSELVKGDRTQWVLRGVAVLLIPVMTIVLSTYEWCFQREVSGGVLDYEWYGVIGVCTLAAVRRLRCGVGHVFLEFAVLFGLFFVEVVVVGLIYFRICGLEGLQ
ncbi:MAG: hypothetical protein A2269_07565 [Lentisphaerae bacterium RIFOXYA12_FULL_60_10]|nr:MAG: hypothetical protein A2269_07565 [Lentisphaerae bacterium RIFOXYA12_FULL_60_10]